MEKMFEKAMRNQYRFAFRGMITTEDLWELDFFELDSVFKALNKELSALDETDSLMSANDNRTAERIDTLKTKIEIVKYVFEVKRQEWEEQKKQAENLALKKRLTDILAEKQEDSLKNLTEEQLIAKINELS